jgi:hypothetical protein
VYAEEAVPPMLPTACPTAPPALGSNFGGSANTGCFDAAEYS